MNRSNVASPEAEAGGPFQTAEHVSVVMPVYNERYLVAEAVRRVLAVQSPLISQLDLIIVDDGSTDGTRESCEASPPASQTASLTSSTSATKEREPPCALASPRRRGGDGNPGRRPRVQPLRSAAP